MAAETFNTMHLGTRDDKTEALLGDSLRTNEETEDIGNATLEQLRRQREQLESASGAARRLFRRPGTRLADVVRFRAGTIESLRGATSRAPVGASEP